MTRPTHTRIPAPLQDLAYPIDKLTRYPGNPRRGNIDVIAESLQVNGQYRPLVANRRTGQVLAGNHTLAAACRLGWTHVAVSWVDVDEIEAARIVLVDNRSNDSAGYDNEDLVQILMSLPDMDFSGTGYTPADLDALIDTLDEELPKGDGDIEVMPAAYGVIVECDTEEEQTSLLARFLEEGHKVRALM